MEIKQHIARLKEMLNIEREEDLKQYQEHFSKNNINYRKEKGVTWYPVVITQVEIGLGEYLHVDIERTTNHREPHQFSGGKQASLFSQNHPDEKPLQGTVKMIGPDKMRLSLTVDELPDWCDEGKLGVNLLFDENSYREMFIALEKVMNAEHNRLAQLRDILYGEKKPSFEEEDNSIQISKLNASQNNAVRKIIAAKDIAIIHGPPGTGKTTTLVQSIIQVLKTEKQVLVCSPSNTAVDLLTEKLHREGVSVLRLGNPAKISDEVLINTLDVKMSKHESYSDLKAYRKRAEEFFRMAGKYKRKFGKEEREQRNLLYTEARGILKDASRLEDHIMNDQFDKAQVIACTPVISAGRFLRDKKFTTVFIDEAGQALEPMSWIPITRSERIIFAGDHFQLPPTVKSNKQETADLKISLFERCMKLPGVSVMLDTQYRMHENIMQFSNEKFYYKDLKADETVKESLLQVDEFLNMPVEFIDTAGCGFNEKIDAESLSISNPEEAGLLLKHLVKLTTSLEYNKEIKIGVISPYMQQVQLLTQSITENEELEKWMKNISVKTVDGFQGQERDIIYISLVRSNSNQEIGFLQDTRRMNVALTRAKKKLVVLGDSSTFGNHPFYKDFLDYIERINAYHSAWEYISVE